MTDNSDPVAYNRAAWDREVDQENEWTRPVGPDVIARARAGDWSVVLIGYEPVPRDWFPADLAGATVLCLASGGGQQGPVLAAAGADVTVFDNSPRQLGRDEEVAARDGLDPKTIRTVLGDMRDLSTFGDGRFDLVFNPVSNVFCPDLAPVWRECFRVLRPAGVLLTGFMNPDLFIFDVEALDMREEFVVRHRIPFSTADLPEEERRRAYGDGPIEYSHTLTEQIGGQLAAGFTLTHLAEAPHHADATARYMAGYIATRAVKPPRARLLSVKLRDRRLIPVERTLHRPARSRRQPVHRPPEPGRRIRLQHLSVSRNAHDHQPDRPVGTRAQVRGPVQDALGGVIGEPRVPERQYPVEHARPVPAHQHRRIGPLGRLRPGPDSLERDVLAGVARLVRRPDRLHGLDPLAQQNHPPPRVGPVVGHLLPVPARADAELEPSAGQVVDAGYLLGSDDRIPLDD